MFSLRLNGTRQAAAALRSAGQRRTAAVRAVVERFTDLVAREAQGLAPYDQGDLRASIRGFMDAAAQAILGRVEAAAPHAPYVEFGTGARVAIPAGLEQAARKFYVDGSGNSPAQPFLFPAFEMHRADFVRAIKRAAGAGR